MMMKQIKYSMLLKTANRIQNEHCETLKSLGAFMIILGAAVAIALLTTGVSEVGAVIGLSISAVALIGGLGLFCSNRTRPRSKDDVYDTKLSFT